MNNNIILKLKRNNGFKWFDLEGRLFVKGYVYGDNGECISGINLLNYIKGNVANIDALTDFVKQLNGMFVAILIKDDSVTIVTDKTYTFPIFFKIEDNKYYISDECEELIYKNSDIIDNNITQLIIAGTVLGNDTIYSNIYQTKPSEILVLKENKYVSNIYFTMSNTSAISEDKTLDDYIRQYLDIIQSVGERLVNDLNGRQALLFLSAGYDSRLIANMLKLNNYNNVLLITYGKKDSYEVHIARNVAKKLGYDWVFVEYTDELINRGINKDFFDEFMRYSGNNTSRPYLQDYFAIDYLIDNKLIDKKTVILNGNRNRMYIHDFAGGIETFIHLDRNQVINHIVNNYYDNNDPIFKDYIAKKIDENLCVGYSYEQMDEWMNKTVIYKFLKNGQQNYDFFNMEFRLPLLDDEIMNFFKQLPIKIRHEDLFYQNVNIEYIFQRTNTSDSKYPYPKISKNKLFVKLKSKDSISHLINKILLLFKNQYTDMNNLKTVIKILYPKVQFTKSIEYWYNQNISRWYIDKFINKTV